MTKQPKKPDPSLDEFVAEKDKAKFTEHQRLTKTLTQIRGRLREREKELEEVTRRLEKYEHPSLHSVEVLLSKRDTLTREQIAKELHIDLEVAEKLVVEMSERGYNVEEGVLSKAAGPRVSVEHFYGKEARFGIVSDTHIGNKHALEEQLHEAYAVFHREGIDTVYAPGNLIDGEKTYKGQEYEITVMGVDNVVSNLAQTWPQIPGITTYHVASSTCHEGYYLKSAGILIGKLIEQARPDMIYLGLDEADIYFHEQQDQPTLRIVHPGGGTSYADSYRPQKIVECVPLDSEILTKDGWRTHDQINTGDEVLGYNPETGRCEWTILQDIHYGTGRVAEYQNQQFRIQCTEDHKWVMDTQYDQSRLTRQRKARRVAYRKEHGISQDAPLGCGRPWVVGDLPKVPTLRPIDGTRERVRIIQAASAVDGPGLQEWTYSDFLRKDQAVRRVLQMTSGERRAFIEGLLLGEGTIQYNKSGSWTVSFSQKPGAVCDAFRLACMLEGIATSEYNTPAGSYHPDDRDGGRRVNLLHKPYRRVGGMKKTVIGTMKVWCPTTQLGTWVMRQGKHITITGNSYSGGEKPQILVIGHYHKTGYYDIRDVAVLQAGCLERQTPFMRKRSLRAALGFWIVEVTFTEEGSLRRFKPEFFKYYIGAKGQVLRSWKA